MRKLSLSTAMPEPGLQGSWGGTPKLMTPTFS
jgi:hypothetical protein